MGKGDKRSKRGKIFAGSFGKTRLRKKKVTVKPVEAKPAKKKAKAPAAE
jgi:30S ribosomal protein S31